MKLGYFLIILMLILPTIQYNTNAATNDKYTILFDEGHEQFFTSDLLNTALESLEDNLNITVDIRIINESFTEENIQGTDLVFITNPGLNGSEPLIIDEAERNAIENYILIGGSVLFMGNPYNSNNATLSGHANTLNQFIISDLNARLYTNDNDNTTVILDDFKNNGVDNSHVTISTENINSETISNEFNNLTNSNILLNSAALIPGDADYDVIGNTSISSYAVDNEYNFYKPDENFNHESNLWMAGQNIENGKALLIGSTIMFSDLPYSDDSSSKWIDQESNLELFQNIIAWLFNITPVESGQNVIDNQFGYYILYSLLTAIGITIIILVSWIVLLKRKNAWYGFKEIRLPKKSVVSKNKEKVEVQPIKKFKDRRKRL